MSQHFYYQIMGETFGPMSGVELRQKSLEGDVGPNTLVRSGVNGEWYSASRYNNLFDESGKPITHEQVQTLIPEWYIRGQDEIHGPTSFADLKGLVEAGQVNPRNLLRKGAEGHWIPARQVKGLFQGHRDGFVSPEAPNSGFSAPGVIDSGSATDSENEETTTLPIASADSSLVPLSEDQLPAEQYSSKVAPGVHENTQAGAEQLTQEDSSKTEVTRCPYCAEQILEAATKCKHCGEFIGPEEQKRIFFAVKKEVKLLRGYLFLLTVGIIAIGIYMFYFSDSLHTAIRPPSPVRQTEKSQETAPQTTLDKESQASQSNLETSQNEVVGEVVPKKSPLLPDIQLGPVNGAQVGAPTGISTKVDVRDENLVQWAAMVEQSVVRIEIDMGGGVVYMGSGFVLDDNGTIVTNFHVVGGAQGGRVIFHNGDAREVLGFLATSAGSDLALLCTSLPDNVSPLKLSEEVPPKGTFVYTVGSPEGLNDSISNGIVSAVRTGEEIGEQIPQYFELLGYSGEVTWIQTTAPISSGNSGGPLVAADGLVVGVNTWHHPEGQNLNFAVTAAEISKLLIDEEMEVLPLAALPKPKKQKVAVGPPGKPEQGVPARVRKILNDIDIERLVIIQQKDSAEAQLSDLRQKYSSAAARYTRLVAEGMAVQATVFALKAKLNSTFDEFLRAGIQSEIRSYTAHFVSLDSQALEVNVISVSIQNEMENVQSQLNRLMQQSDGLLLEWLKLMDPFGKASRGENEAVLQIFAEWIIKDRENVFAYAFRAIYLSDLQQFDEARQDCQQVMLLAPGHWFGFMAEGYICLKQGLPRQAIPMINMASKQAPFCHELHLLRGDAFSQLRSYRRAIDNFKKVIDRAPGSAWGHQRLGLLLAACPAETRRNGKVAVKHALKACELTAWKSSKCVGALAAAHAESDDFDKAIEWGRKALALAPLATRPVHAERLKLYEAGQPFRLERDKPGG
jgi:S1-C subfamily serine protease/tetratricopeptide (TPR) repeat protein